MTPLQQIINSLETEPELWTQGHFTLDHKYGFSIWTANIPYLDIGIYKPSRKIGFIDKIRLQIAVNRWHKKPLIMKR